MKFMPNECGCDLCDKPEKALAHLRCFSEHCDNFQICLECCNDDCKLKDARGHPLRHNTFRDQNKAACSYCGEYSKGIVSCTFCSLDVCIVCSNKDDLGLFNFKEDREEIQAVWKGENPTYLNKNSNFKSEKYFRLDITIAKDGQVSGVLNDGIVNG